MFYQLFLRIFKQYESLHIISNKTRQVMSAAVLNSCLLGTIISGAASQRHNDRHKKHKISL